MRRASTLSRSLFTLLLLTFSWVAQADVFRPAYLELKETSADHYNVLWRVPANGTMRLAAYVIFPEDVEKLSDPQSMLISGSYVERYKISRAGGLTGQLIAIKGIGGGLTDVMARIERLDGTSQVERLLPERPAFEVKPPQGIGDVAWTYLVLGFEHILQGIDHLLFVLALLIIVKGSWRIVATITAFTVAHSITLVTASMGWIFAPGPPVEACIALSIVFVAAEIIHGIRRKPGLTARAPWLVAFGFGLLHGFGFASALSEMGLPQTAVPLALLMFNVGVELGQLAFVLMVFSLIGVSRSLKINWASWTHYIPPYVIGSIATYWMFDRVLIGFFS